MTARHKAFLLLFSCIALLSATSAYAQLGFGETFTISFTPRNPAAGETVRVTAESLLMDLETGEITWYVNGARGASGSRMLETQVTAGPPGSQTRVRATFTQDGIEIASAEAIIRPTEVDLLWEANSYTPPFFRGRALPSAGTSLRMEALPRFSRLDGSLIPTEDITFTWRRNGYVIASASGRGKYQARIPSPPLFGTDTIAVEARSLDGSLSGEASVRIPSTEPTLALYENHPIFGILYHRAFGAQNTLSEVEASFTAVPYFAEAGHPADGRLTYEWRVNGNPVVNDQVRPNEITVNAAGSTGIARIELALSHLTNLYFSASGSWGVTFLSDTLDALSNPFGTTP